MSELLEKFKQHLRENEESYKNGARDSIEYPLGYEEVKLLLNEIERLNNIIKRLEKWLKFFNENGLVIDLEDGKQTTVMSTLAVIEKIEELKGNNK